MDNVAKIENDRKPMKIKIKGKEYEVDIKGDEEAGKIKITISGKEFFFDAEECAKKEDAPEIGVSLPRRDLSAKEIKALIAGSVSEVFVKEGDSVKSGEKLLTLSAMKMENEIVSDCGGKIKKVLVVKDQKVKEGDVLIIIV